MSEQKEKNIQMTKTSEKKGGKLELAKRKAKEFWSKNKKTIKLIGGVVGTAALGVLGLKKYSDYLEAHKEDYKDEYKPMRLIDKDGQELHVFKWNAGTEKEPDFMYFNEEDIGWSDEIDWDKC